MNADEKASDPEATGPDSQPSTADPAADMKRKMREVLEAKKQRQGEAHLDNDQATIHAHGPVEKKRVFRRKTG